jgi:phage baseplate assembly protein W
MTGMDRNTGGPLDGAAHIAQSVGDILSTPLGSRVMRRTYGSRLFELQDLPADRSTLLLYAAATAGALRAWEPRLKLTKVTVTPAATGALMADITAVRTDLPAQPTTTLSLPLN